MAKRTYGQYCGLAHALEIVGERWALLIVRDLVLGPKRFTDLRRGLPRIPTNILSTRLKELEQADVVRRRVLPRPAASVVYELTDYGRELEDIGLALARWGARSLGRPGPEDTTSPDSLALTLRATFHPEAAAGVRAGYEIRLGDENDVVHARVEDGVLDTGLGERPGADLVIETDQPLLPLLAGAITPRQAIDGGRVRLTGDPALLTAFVEIFRLTPEPSAAR